MSRSPSTRSIATPIPFPSRAKCVPPNRAGSGWLVGGWVVAALLIVALLAQLAWWQRETVLVYCPRSQALYAKVCEQLNCQIMPPHDIDGLQVEPSDLRQIDGPHKLELKMPLRNRFNVPLAYPAIELTLLDDQNNVAVRRVLWPQDYVRPGTPIASRPAAAQYADHDRASRHGQCGRFQFPRTDFLSVTLSLPAPALTRVLRVFRRAACRSSVLANDAIFPSTDIFYMSQVTLGGNPIEVAGTFPSAGHSRRFLAGRQGSGNLSLADFAGKRKVLNIVPSLDTPTCATSTRKFNEAAAKLTTRR